MIRKFFSKSNCKLFTGSSQVLFRENIVPNFATGTFGKGAIQLVFWRKVALTFLRVRCAKNRFLKTYGFQMAVYVWDSAMSTKVVKK